MSRRADANHLLQLSTTSDDSDSQQAEHEEETDSDEEEARYWVDWFLSGRGNELFCEVDQEYIADRFNLTGLYTEVPHFSLALDCLLDQGDEQAIEDVDPAELEKSAQHLYGLIHARYILTGPGQAKMMEKYKRSEFGRCPRHLCQGQALLPVGLTDQSFQKAVKLFCPRCEDVYHPKLARHQVIDGAYFGTTFPHLFLLVYPEAVPVKLAERYEPCVFGFRVHPLAKRMRAPPAELVQTTVKYREVNPLPVPPHLVDGLRNEDRDA